MNQAPQEHPQPPQVNANDPYIILVNRVIDGNDVTPEEVAELSQLLSSRNELHVKILEKDWVQDDNRGIKLTSHSGAEGKVLDKLELYEIGSLLLHRQKIEVIVFGCNGQRYQMNLELHRDYYRLIMPNMFQFWIHQALREERFIIWLFN